MYIVSGIVAAYAYTDSLIRADIQRLSPTGQRQRYLDESAIVFQRDLPSQVDALPPVDHTKAMLALGNTAHDPIAETAPGCIESRALNLSSLSQGYKEGKYYSYTRSI